MKPFAKKFYKSKAWRECRKLLVLKKHGLCDRCGEPGNIGHHTVYLTPDNINDPLIALNLDLLELHCQECHNKEHHGSGAVVENGLMFDENGDLVKAYPPIV